MANPGGSIGVRHPSRRATRCKGHNVGTDWQLWVEMGAEPIPRKLMITARRLTTRRKDFLRTKSRAIGVEPGPGAFAAGSAGRSEVDHREPRVWQTIRTFGGHGRTHCAHGGE
ncbi:DUF2092 domain-containing protein [Bauldia litoralis]|uniref:DUF2092 domain-containing protein n=2 Tax=Bauldia litoralis TaxID=665467 RepID=UPI003D663A5D